MVSTNKVTFNKEVFYYHGKGIEKESKKALLFFLIENYKFSAETPPMKLFVFIKLRACGRGGIVRRTNMFRLLL
jgi:hypothetical protein